MCQFKDYFFQKIYDKNKTEHNFQELCDLTRNMGLTCLTDIIKSQLNIQDCLLGNKKGQQLIEFLLRRPYADIENTIKQEIKHYLEKHHSDGHLTHEDGFLWIAT